MEPIKIYLIRHGQTELNRSKIFRGRLDFPLNEIGFNEAHLTANLLKKIDISFLISSPLLRATQTAEVIAKYHELEVLKMHEFIDINFGEWEGMKEEEVANHFSHSFSLWHSSPHKVKFPNGESLLEVKNRLKNAIKKIRKNYTGQNGIVVTHRVVCKVFMCLLIGVPLKNFWNIKIDTSSISLLEILDNHSIIHFLNETNHLKKINKYRVINDF